jgi:[ribosomal protein S5]-alanine N-acetyltransferase
MSSDPCARRIPLGVRLLPPDPPLQMSEVTLRLMRTADLTALVSASGDPLIRKYVMSTPEPGDAESAAWVQLQLRAWTSETARFAIAEKRTDQLVGSISLHVVGETTAQIGFWIAPVHRRKGHATAALELVTQWSFRDLCLQHVSLLTDIDNDGSQGVAAGAGFLSDGIVTNYDFGLGLRRDVILWSRTASD